MTSTGLIPRSTSISVKCRQVVEEVPEDAVPMVLAWSAHFQDACAAFGMETALIKMMTEPEMFKAVIDRIMQFSPQGQRDLLRNDQGQASRLC